MSFPAVTWTVRPFASTDEPSWLRCRVLGFLDTAYFDDVWPAKPPGNGPDLVAVTGDGTVAGILSTTVRDDAATIETVVVHPDHRRRGVGTALLDDALARLCGRGITELDAWTRDDEDTLAWYRAMGFTENSHYLHIYADRYAGEAEPDQAGVTARSGLRPMVTFLHGRMPDEQWARATFKRVHVCRRFSRIVAPARDR